MPTESFEMRKARLAQAITNIASLIDTHEGFVSPHAIADLSDAKTELEAELYRLQEHAQ